MTVSTETTRVVFTGDGTDNSPYAISFPLRNTGSVEVIYVTVATGVEVVRTITTNYTIALADGFATADLTIVGGDAESPASGVNMLIRTKEPMTRLSDYRNFDGQPSDTFDSDYDKGVMKDRTLQEQLDRAIVVAKGHPTANLPLTPLNLIGNAGKIVSVNAGETDWELVAGTASVLDDESFCFGDDDDFCLAYDSGANALEIRNEAGTPLVTITDSSNTFAQNSTFSGTLASGALTVTGAVTISTTLAVTGNSTLSDVFIANGKGLAVGNVTFASFSHLPEFQVVGTTISDSSIGIGRWSADADGPSLVFHKSRNTTIDSQTVLQDGDGIGIIRFLGVDTNTTQRFAASISVEADGAPGSGTVPGKLIFSTTLDGEVSPTERMVIDNAGAVVITGTLASGALTVTGAVTISTTLAVTGNSILTGTLASGALTVTGASALNGAVSGITTLATSGLATLDSLTVTNAFTVTDDRPTITSTATSPSTELLELVDVGGAHSFANLKIRAFRPGIILEDQSGSPIHYRVGIDAGLFILSIDTDDDLAKGATGHFDDVIAWEANASGDFTIPVGDLEVTAGTTKLLGGFGLQAAPTTIDIDADNDLTITDSSEFILVTTDTVDILNTIIGGYDGQRITLTLAVADTMTINHNTVGAGGKIFTITAAAISAINLRHYVFRRQAGLWIQQGGS